MRIIICIVMLCLIGGTKVFSQIQMKGNVVDTLSQPIPYASIHIGKGDQILKSLYSDDKGAFHYQIPANVSADSIWMEANHISYVTRRIKWSPNVSTFTISMSEKAYQLQEIEVKSRPLAMRSKGDTLRYAVSQFVSAEDRNIGDVLKRMPGVTVEESGAIKYNGQGISGMYVDGDHVFNNGYGMGTRTIQPKLIKDVEIMKNHQHKKMNADEASQNVALNLVLHEDARMIWSGEATLGGAAPLDYYGQANAMSFKKSYKNISNLQANSIGETASQDVQSIGGLNLVEPIHADAPSLPLLRYYANQSVSVNTNHHYKFSPVWNTHLNAVLWKDRESLNSRSQLNYLVDPQNPIRFDNETTTQKSPLFGQFVWEMEGNSDHFYIKNKLNWRGQSSKSDSWLQDQGSEWRQFGSERDFSFQESFEFQKKLKTKDQINFSLSAYKESHRDQAEWSPGKLPTGQDDESVSSIWQGVQTPEQGINLSLEYTNSRKKLKKGIYVKGSMVDKALNSYARSFSDQWQAMDGFDNNMSWNHQQASMGLQLNFKNRDWMWTANLPVSFNQWDMKDPLQSFENRTVKTLFSPQLFVQYYLRSRDYFRLNFSFNNSNAELKDLFRGPILSNFRSVRRQDVPMYFTQSQMASLQFTMERPIQLFNANFGLTYANSQMDFIANQVITSQGFVYTMIPYKHRMEQWSLQSNVAQSNLDARIFAKVQVTGTHQQYESMLNDQIAPGNYTSFGLQPSIEYKGLSFVTLQYLFGYQYGWGERGLKDQRVTQNNSSQRHEISTLFGIQKVYAKLSWSYQTEKAGGVDPLRNGFLDARAWTTVGKSKHRIEMQLQNILNKTSYSTYSLSPTQQNRFDYPLRGIQGVLKYSFVF
jgi:hypothetical protein